MPPPRPAILSEHTGRQVSAAFGELSDAFASRSKKTFDEMAEEMLRPMLQDWLDNNLPTLVERLVREEIERVARGAQ
jgi:cell pole-organizing protein PopZ